MTSDELGAEPLFQLQNLQKTFVSGGLSKRKFVHAVREFNLELSAGSAVGLVGESGSGKSTVARVSARLTQPTSGKIMLRGRDVLDQEPHHASRSYRREVQMVFQDPFSSLNPAHTIKYHLDRALRIHDTVGESIETSRQELLSQVGLSSITDISRRFPYELSGGQRQRVAIARSLAARPSLLIADEPTSMLDVSVRVGVLNLLRDLRQDRGIALLLITHDLASARYSTDYLNVMYRGYVVEYGPTDDVTERPLHPYTQLLLDAVPRRTNAGRPVQQSGQSSPDSSNSNLYGCPFFARCPLRMPVCESTMPEKTRINPTRWVRCHAVASANGHPSTHDSQTHNGKASPNDQH